MSTNKYLSDKEIYEFLNDSELDIDFCTKNILDGGNEHYFIEIDHPKDSTPHLEKEFDGIELNDELNDPNY